MQQRPPPQPSTCIFLPPTPLLNQHHSIPPLPSHEIHATAAEDKKVPSAIFAPSSPHPRPCNHCVCSLYIGLEERGEESVDILAANISHAVSSLPFSPLLPSAHGHIIAHCSYMGGGGWGGQIFERESGGYYKINHKWGKYSSGRTMV